MTLRDFLHKFRIKQRDFAEVTGISEGVISSYVTGRAIPTLRGVLIIERATCGYVGPYDWESYIEDPTKCPGILPAAYASEEKLRMIAERCLEEIGLAFHYDDLAHRPEDENEITFGSECAACAGCEGDYNAQGCDEEECKRFTSRADLVFESITAYALEAMKLAKFEEWTPDIKFLVLSGMIRNGLKAHDLRFGNIKVSPGPRLKEGYHS